MTKLPNQIFKDQSAPATALLAAYINMYGLNHFDDEPEAVRANIKDDLNINLTDLQCNKLQAAITVLTTNQYEVNMQAFEGINHIFNNKPYEFGTFYPLEAEELVNGFAEFVIIKDCATMADEKIEFSDDIRSYAGHVFFYYGMSKAPKVFPQALIPLHIVDCDDSAKNEALDSIFDSKIEKIIEYLS